MFDDIATYYHDSVVTPYVEYRDQSGDGVAGRNRDVRGALISAGALFHLREHLPSGVLTRAEVERRCPDYSLLGDIVNAAKHKSVTQQTPHGAPLVANATSISEVIQLIEYEDEEGLYRYAQKTVIVTLTDGSERNILDVLTTVINFWEQYLSDIGVLSTPRTFVQNQAVRLRSRAECEANRLNFEIVQGQRFHQVFRLLRFNPTTGKAVPIDVTGSEFAFKVYKPSYSVDVFLSKNGTGEEVKTTITLSDDESSAFAKLSSDSERNAFLMSLKSAKIALQALALEVDGA